jgi:hypothetical protein
LLYQLSAAVPYIWPWLLHSTSVPVHCSLFVSFESV